MSVTKTVVVELVEVEKEERVARVEGIVDVTVSVDICMDKDELDAAGLLRDLEDDDDESVVARHVQDNFRDYIEDVAGSAQVENNNLITYRDSSGGHKWPDLDEDEVYLFKFADGSMSLTAGGHRAGLDETEEVWLITDGSCKAYKGKK